MLFLAAMEAGRIYERNITLPVLGSQRIRLRILDDAHAAIRMSGAMTLEEEEFEYACHDDSFTFDLGPRTTSLLSTYHTRLQGATFLPHEDVAVVTVKPPLIPAMRIRMTRIPS